MTRRVILSIVVLLIVATIVSVVLWSWDDAGAAEGDVVQVIPQEPLDGIPQEPIIVTRTKPDLGPDATEQTFEYEVDP